MPKSDNKILARNILKIVQSQTGVEGVTEHRFHPVRRWRFDLAWPDKMLAVEIEGGIWSQGRHVRGSGFKKDMEKYNAAVLMGWRLLRFEPKQMRDMTAIPLIIDAINNHIPAGVV